MIEIKIRLNGDFPGAAERRFSIDALGEPMSKLLHAARSIATQIVTEALDEPNYGVAGGRLAKDASLLDLQVGEIGEGSLMLRICLVLGLIQGRLFEDLPARTGRVLVEAIREESSGNPTSGVVRKYLRSLPGGVSSQKYELFEDGTKLSEVEFGNATLPAIPEGLPYLLSLSAQVIGVGFEPGKTEVRVRTTDGTQMTLVATGTQVETALKIRSETVRVRAVANKKVLRLISLSSATEERPTPTEKEINSLVFEKWDALLRRFA